MEKIVIKGGNRLKGEVAISGAKNAVVAIIPAAILAEEPCRIENIPDISDVLYMNRILYYLGAKIKPIDRSTIEIDPRNITNAAVSYDIAKNMRATCYLMGALLGRFGHAKVTMPGGCNLGMRPIDQHLKGFASLGAKAAIKEGLVGIDADQLTGSQIYLDIASVGATVNIILAAVKAKGMTVIENAAKEPHIVDLANFLNSMGADVRGAGTDVIKIYGVEHLGGTTYSIIPDQIEAGTFMAAAAATGGDVLVRNVIPKHLDSITAKLEEMGVQVEEYDDAVRVRREGPLQRCNIKTMPHPGFPTDMQSQIAVLLSMAQGTSILTESVCDSRFRYVEELRRMGAQVTVDGKIAVFEGVPELTGAQVKATDLRAGAAMMIAGLAAKGVTQIEDIYHIERGYEHIEEKFRCLGGDVSRVIVPDSVLQTAL